MSTSTDLTIRKSVVVDAPPEQAFEVFTDGLATWWPLETHSIEGPPQTVVFEPREGGRLYEVMTSGKEAHWATVTAWEPPHRFVLAWHVNPEREAPTDVEVRFAAEGGGTRVDLEHSGWERLGADAEEAASGYASEGGWTLVLERYVAVVNKD